MRDKFTASAVLMILWLVCASSSSAQVGVVNGLTQEKAVKPGEIYQGIIVLKNSGNTEEKMKLYQTDYSFNYEGKSFYDAPGTLPRSNASWIQVGLKQLAIPPRGQVEVRYTVKVPGDAALTGTYWSMIMVENVPQAQTVKSDAAKKQVTFGVHQVMRYGVQIVNHIGDSGVSKLKFLDTELVEEKDLRTLRVDVENIGERWLRPFSYVELYNEKGELC